MCYFKCLTRNNINILNLLFGKNSTYTKLISYMNLLLFLKAGGVKDIVLLSYGPFNFDWFAGDVKKPIASQR